MPRRATPLQTIGYEGTTIDAVLTRLRAAEVALLIDVRWFSRAEIADPEPHGFMLPRADSIARRLIEDWMAST